MSVLNQQNAEAGYEMPRLTVGRRRFVPLEAIEEFIAGLPTEYRRSA